MVLCSTNFSCRRRYSPPTASTVPVHRGKAVPSGGETFDCATQPSVEVQRARDVSRPTHLSHGVLYFMLKPSADDLTCKLDVFALQNRRVAKRTTVEGKFYKRGRAALPTRADRLRSDHTVYSQFTANLFAKETHRPTLSSIRSKYQHKRQRAIRCKNVTRLSLYSTVSEYLSSSTGNRNFPLLCVC